jgi:hypothetical protein
MATQEQVAQLLTSLAEMYPSSDMGASAPMLWADLLADVPADALALAARKHLRTSRFFPTVSELMDAARDVPGWRHRTGLTEELHQIGLEHRQAVRALPAPAADDLWQICLGEIRLRMASATFHAHLAGSTGVVDGDRLTVTVPSRYSVEWIDQRLRHLVENVVAHCHHLPMVVEFRGKDDPRG